MQKLVAFLLLVAFAGQTFDQGWYYLSYLIEKKEYMKRCENKARPQLHCDGKCLLMKKIKEQQEKDHGQAPELKLAAKTEIISPKDHLLLAAPKIQNKVNTFIIRTIGFPVSRPSSLFHPPDFV